MFEKFAVVIEPNKEIDGDLVMLKNVFKKYSVNDYINHPNHLTLLHGFFQEDQLIKALENIFFESFTIETEKIKCFSQDLLTQSKTLFLSIKHEKKLLELQMDFLQKLKNIIDNRELGNFFSNNPMYKKNIEIYNYPYVGKDWVPHFTVCSLNDIKNNEYNNFINKSISKKMTVRKVSIFKVINSDHIKILEI